MLVVSNSRHSGGRGGWRSGRPGRHFRWAAVKFQSVPKLLTGMMYAYKIYHRGGKNVTYPERHVLLVRRILTSPSVGKTGRYFAQKI